MAQTICPVRETEIAEDTDLCPECGWEIDRSAGELIIGDPTELQQEAERKHRKIQQHRRLYQQAKRVEGLEKRITELAQGQQQNSCIETIQNRLTKLETWQQKILKRRYCLRSTPLTVSDEMQYIFQVDIEGQPLHYVVNNFEVQGEVDRDHVTGLIWQQAGSKESLTYQSAQKYIEQLNQEHFGGYPHWRLPTVDELLSLMTEARENGDLYISTVFDGRQRLCWSVDKRSQESAWVVNFDVGYVGDNYVGLDGYVRAYCESPNVDYSVI